MRIDTKEEEEKKERSRLLIVENRHTFYMVIKDEETKIINVRKNEIT